MSAALATSMSPRGVALMRTLQATFAAMNEHAKLHPHEVVELAAVAASHIRSAFPMAMLAETGPIVLADPPVAPALAAVEPSWLIERALHDGAKYTLKVRGVDGEAVILFQLEDAFGDSVNAALTVEAFDQLRADQDRVYAAAKAVR